MIKPLNTSGRSKEEIVAEAEATWLLPHLVSATIVCLPHCRCLKCYHRSQASITDKYVEQSRQMREYLAKAFKKEVAHDSPSGTTRSADRNELQAGAGADEAGVPWKD